MVKVPDHRQLKVPQSQRPRVQPTQGFDPAPGNAIRGIGNIVLTLQARRQQAEDAGFKSNIAANSERRFTEIYNEHKNTVSAGEEFTTSLDEKLQKAQEEVVKQAQEQGGYRPSKDAQQSATLVLSNLRGGFLTKAATYQNNARVERIVSDSDTFMNQLASQSYHNPDALTDNLNQANQAGEALRAVIPAAEADAIVKDQKREITLSAINGLIDNDPLKAIDYLEANQENPYLDSTDHIRLKRAAEAKIAQQKNKIDAAMKKQAAEYVSDTIKSYENGIPVTEAEYLRAVKATELTGDREQLEVAKAASQYILFPKSDREGLPETLEGPEQAELRIALEKADEIIQREVEKDGYAFAVKQRLVDDIPLDLTQPETVQARLDQADYLSQHYGYPVSPLKEAEADRLVDSLPDMSPQEKTTLAMAFGTNKKIWEQLDKKNAGTFAMVGAIGDEKVMDGVFKGQKLLVDKLIELPEDRATLLQEFDDIVGGIYVGNDRRAMFDASVAYYAALNGPSAENGFFVDDSFEDAVQAVSGGIAKINGGKVQLPRGVEENTFEDYIDEFSANDVAHFGGVWSMSNEQAAKLIQNARIQSVGDNRYMVDVDGAVLMTADGQKPFEFSFDPELLKIQRNKILSDLETQRRELGTETFQFSEEMRERLGQ